MVEGHAVLPPVEAVAATAAQEPLSPPYAAFGVAPEAGVAPSAAPVTAFGRLRQASDGAVVQASLPTREAGMHAAQVVRLAPQAAARAEGGAVVGPYAPVVSGTALRGDADNTPLAPVLMPVVSVPDATAYDAVPAVPLPAPGADAYRVPSLAAVPTKASTAEVDGVPRLLPSAPGLSPVRLRLLSYASAYARVRPLGDVPSSRPEAPAPVGRLALSTGGVTPRRGGAGIPPITRTILRAVVRRHCFA